MYKKIMLVNDDGIHAEGLEKLAEAAARFGKVWVVAPNSQCSAMSMRLSVFDKITVTPYGFPATVEGAWVLDGTPVDCVKIALKVLLPEKPDVVICGINNGFNTGFDIAYSGTVGAAMEARMQGIPAIAFSNAYNGSFETAEAYLPLLIEDLIFARPEENEIWNVNFPGVSLDECAGIQTDCSIAPMQLYRDLFQREELDGESFRLHNRGEFAKMEEAPEGSDIHGVLNGYVTVGRIPCQVL